MSPSSFMLKSSGKVMLTLWSLCRGRTGQLDAAHRVLCEELSVETGRDEVFQEVHP